jgi:DNA-binding HxlR family transcriptional regulator
MQKAALTKLSVGVIYGRLKERDLTMPHRCDVSVIDGRWKGTILWRLLDGPMRTNELRKSIPEITERMLLRHLRDMTGAGILERHQEQGLPLRVRYSLTPYGRTLVPVLDVLCSWGREHLKRDPST